MAVYGPVRFSFMNVFTPKADLSGRMKYSCQCLIPKTDKKLIAQIEADIKQAVLKGVEKGKFKSAAISKSPNFKDPLRDGDQYFEEAPGPAREACRGHMFFNASQTAEGNAPPVKVDAYNQPIMNPEDLYSGCWGMVNGNFYAFSANGSNGVAFGLNGIMKKRDDDRLDGRENAMEAFGQYADLPDEAGGEVAGGSEGGELV